jgi:beta-lactamase regulating signal transducer with metallopeptidase domain
MASLLIPVTIKVTFVLCAAWGVSRTMARRSAAARHLVWAIALMSALAIPVVQAAAPRWNLPVLPVAPPVVASVAGMDRISERAWAGERAGSLGDLQAPAQTPPRAVNWSWLLTRVWLVGAGLFLLRLTLGTWWAALITRRSARVIDPGWMSMLDAARATLRVTGRVRLCCSSRTTIPVACGILRPTILLPDDADSWSEERRLVVLLHELAHVRRRDCLVQFIAHAALALHWFNPAAHLAIGRLRTEQELACDDEVVASGAGPAIYADHLVEIAEAFRRSAFPLWATAAMARPSQLEGRVRAILDLRRNRRSPGRQMCAAAALAAGAFILPIGALGLSKVVPPVVAVAEAAAQTPSPTQPPSAAPRPNPPAPPRAAAAVPPTPPQPPAQAPSTGSSLSDDTRRRVADALMTALSDQDADVRQGAVTALMELATPENAETIAPALIQMLKDPDADVRAHAVRALGQITGSRKGVVTPPAPPQVNIDTLQKAVERAQEEAQWQIERLWNGRSLPDPGNR